jgi:hypothetical protein
MFQFMKLLKNFDQTCYREFHCFTMHFYSLSLLVPTNALFYFNTRSVSVTKMHKTLKIHIPTCFGQLMTIIRESFVPG